MLAVKVQHSVPGFDLDVDFAVDRPGITALFGPSGSGKSSTVHAIAGLLRPQAGRVAVDDAVLLDTGTGIHVPARARRIGYVFQDARLFPHMTVAGNLDYGARRADAPPTPAERARIIEMLGIGHLESRKPAALSGGERQRVALGRALLARPRLLLLDEPLAALDQPRKAEIMPYFEQLRGTLPIVYVSHSVEEVTRLADEIVVLNHGRVAAQGSVFDITARLDLFPLTGRFEAGAVVEGTIARQLEADSLSEIALSAGTLWVPRIDAAPGAHVRIRIRARDVMLALHEPNGISANNVLAGEVAEIRADVGAYLAVLLACGSDRLIARITHRSLARLQLRPGLPVYAVIKSVTVDRHSTAVA
jgi:molybdate transport system ATP-binding protein